LTKEKIGFMWLCGMITPGPYADLIAALCQRRRDAGISQADLDIVLGCAPGYVSKMECGDRRPGAFMLSCWSDALGLKLEFAPVMSIEAVRKACARKASGAYGAVASR